ncbi:MAG: nucleotidyltransferase domain-containing protein [Candidatus Woesearchaeota archaeon]
MLTGKQLKILAPFAREPFRELTLKEIKSSSKSNSNNLLSLAIRKFKEENLIIERKVGRSSLYRANLDSDALLDYFVMVGRSRLPQHIMKFLARFREEQDMHCPFYSIAVFGSYADGSNRKSSDIDIAIFVDKKDARFNLALNGIDLLSTVKVDAHLIPSDEFMEMLSNHEQNLGKEIARNHIIISNPSIFYSLLKKGVSKGFRP